VVPEKNTLFGLFNLQGLVLFILYLLGFFMALFSAYILKLILKAKEKSYFIMELPTYKGPRFKHVSYTILNNVKAFVFEAGKVIVAISIILWVLASYGPGNSMEDATNRVKTQNPTLSGVGLSNKIAGEKLENSYAGHFGKFIEPAIRPLGYDWKIGIALITSFAAREVFVGTMATLYSVGDDADENNNTLRQKMSAAVRADGTKVYNLASGLSLMVFYVLAMQCMSTLAIVKRETRSWKWPAIQLAYMTALAYLLSWLTYIIFS
jgi:ferrous iron transport protein B